MNIEVRRKDDYTIVQIGFEDDIRIDMQEKIKELYKLESPLKDFSLHYPFKIDQLEEWKDILDWEEVSSNLNVKWTDEVIRKFKDRWNWVGLSFNISILCWDEELLDKFKGIIPWDLLIFTSIEWTEELHNRFEKYLTWERSKYSYEMVKEYTTKNRTNFLRNSNNNLSESFMNLYLYAKSIDEEMGIFILYDAIQEYFDSKIKQ